MRARTGHWYFGDLIKAILVGTTFGCGFLRRIYMVLRHYYVELVSQALTNHDPVDTASWNTSAAQGIGPSAPRREDSEPRSESRDSVCSTGLDVLSR